MDRPPVLILYRREHGTRRYRIAPANHAGLLVFLLNIAAFFAGLFNAIGIWSFFDPTTAIIMLVASVVFYIYSMIFLTDHSGTRD